jgi:hypothetical protein
VVPVVVRLAVVVLEPVRVLVPERVGVAVLVLVPVPVTVTVPVSPELLEPPQPMYRATPKLDAATIRFLLPDAFMPLTSYAGGCWPPNQLRSVRYTEPKLKQLSGLRESVRFKSTAVQLEPCVSGKVTKYCYPGCSAAAEAGVGLRGD